MRFYYAELNEEGIVQGVSDLSGEVIADHMIPLETFDASKVGKRYHKDTGEFEALPIVIEPPTYGMTDLQKDILAIKGDLTTLKTPK